MALLVAPGVCRYAVNGEYEGHDVVNIVDMKIDTTGSTMTRSSACDAQAGIIINEWTDSILPNLVDNYTALSVSWIDLDSETGSVGERSSTDVQNWPDSGSNTDPGMPGSMALRVNKNCVASRGQRQGRMYLCGVAEGFTGKADPNIVLPSVSSAVNTRLEAFLGDLNQGEFGGSATSYASEMVVVHTAAGEFVSASTVTTLTLDQYVATQVRRTRR